MLSEANEPTGAGGRFGTKSPEERLFRTTSTPAAAASKRPTSGRRIRCDRIHAVGDKANLDAALHFERHLTETDRLDAGATET